MTTNLIVIGGLGLLAVILFLSNREESPEKAIRASKTQQKAQTETSIPETPAQKASPQESAGAILTRSDEEGARLNAIGHALIQEGKYDDAIKVLQMALRSFPEGSSSVSYKFALYNLGHSLRRAGRPEEAVPILKECRRLDAQWTKVVQELDLAQQAMDRKKLT